MGIDSFTQISKQFHNMFGYSEWWSEEAYQAHVKEAEEWWMQNHFETEDEYQFRILCPRPMMGAIIYQQ